MKEFNKITQNRIHWLIAKVKAEAPPKSDNITFDNQPGYAPYRITYRQVRMNPYGLLEIERFFKVLDLRIKIKIAVHKKTNELIIEAYHDMIVGWIDPVEFLWKGKEIFYEIADEQEYDYYVEVVERVIRSMWHQQKLPVLKHENHSN
jgi:hypothetical protein